MTQDTFFGYKWEEIIKWDEEQRAKAKAEEERKAQEEAQKSQPVQEPITSAPPALPQSYIILPGRNHGSYEYPDMLVSTQKMYHIKMWHECQKLLHAQNQVMLTIRQFVDFLDHLRSGNVYDANGSKMNSATINAVLDDILTQRDRWRAEWLDAHFSANQSNGLDINYHKPDRTNVTETLQDYLSESAGISLDAWLQNPNIHGLPPQYIAAGDFQYWQPKAGSAAWFAADINKVHLQCASKTTAWSQRLGVRPAQVKF